MSQKRSRLAPLRCRLGSPRFLLSAAIARLNGSAWVDATEDYDRLGTAPGSCHHCHTGPCPVGITTQDPVPDEPLDPNVGARWVTNYLRAMTMEVTTLAQACGKSDVHKLEREDLVALTIETAAMAGVPLAGTNWIPGQGDRDRDQPS